MSVFPDYVRQLVVGPYGAPDLVTATFVQKNLWVKKFLFFLFV